MVKLCKFYGVFLDVASEICPVPATVESSGLMLFGCLTFGLS